MNEEFVQAVSRFRQYLKRRFSNSSTVKHYENDLLHFGRVIDKEPAAVTRADVTEFATSQLAAGLKPATVNRRLAALRSFFDFLDLTAESEDIANPVLWQLHGVKQGYHLPRDLPEPVARALWAAVRRGPARDQALVALMMDVGLRVGEVAALQVDDFEPSTVLKTLAGLRVHGKGDKERKVWLMAETATLLQAWLDERPSVGDHSLFITRRRRGFSVRGIQDRVTHYTRQAGLSPDRVSCHRFRHTFARRMAESGMPLPSLSHWLGHSQIQTTKIYTDGANETTLADYQAAMNSLSQEAERPRIPASPTPPTPEPISLSVSLQPRPHWTQTDLEAKVTELPEWLRVQIVTFVRARQLRWDPFQRRKHGSMWINTLRSAWTWLLQERQITSFVDLRRADLEAYLTYLHESGLSASTRNVYRAIVLSFLHFLEEHGTELVPSLYRTARSKVPERQPRPLTEVEYARLERAVQQVTAAESPQVAALELGWFFTLCDGGLRVNELLTLTVGDWDPERCSLLIRVAKGGHERRVPLTARAAKAINAHISYRPQVTMDEPLLVYRGKPLQMFHVRRWMSIFADRAQVEQLTPHRLRHSYATRLINTGKMPVTTLQKLMGHRRLDTTMKYVALYEEKVIADYQTAMESSQTETDLNWSVWGPTVEAILNQQAPVAASPML